MARVKGRDVLLDLMDSMAELRATVSEQGERLERVARLAEATSTRVGGLVGQVQALGANVEALGANVEALGANVEALGGNVEALGGNVEALGGNVRVLGTHVEALAQDLTGLAQAVRDTATTNLAIQRNLGRAARLIGELAGSTRTRFDELEQRVEKLERKAS